MSWGPSLVFSRLKSHDLGPVDASCNSGEPPRPAPQQAFELREEAWQQNVARFASVTGNKMEQNIVEPQEL